MVFSKRWVKQNKCNVIVKWYFKVLDANLGGKDFNQTNHLTNPMYPFQYSHYQLQPKFQASRNTFPQRQCHKMLSYIGQKVNNSLTCLSSSHLIATKCQRMAPYSKPLNIKAPEELFSFFISFWSSKSSHNKIKCRLLTLIQSTC